MSPAHLFSTLRVSCTRNAEVEPGSVHALTAARAQVLGALYAATAHGLLTLADSGYDSAGIGIHTPIRQPDGNQILSPDNRTYNRLLRALRCLGERGFALLKGRWRTLQHITVNHTFLNITRSSRSRAHAGVPELDPTITLVVGHWDYLGSGYSPGAALLATHIWHSNELERQFTAEGGC